MHWNIRKFPVVHMTNSYPLLQNRKLIWQGNVRHHIFGNIHMKQCRNSYVWKGNWKFLILYNSLCTNCRKCKGNYAFLLQNGQENPLFTWSFFPTADKKIFQTRIAKIMGAVWKLSDCHKICLLWVEKILWSSINVVKFDIAEL